MNIRRFSVGQTVIFLFSTNMLIDELYEYLDLKPEGRLFILNEYNKKNLRISLPKSVNDFLNDDEDKLEVEYITHYNQNIDDLINDINDLNLLTDDNVMKISPSSYINVLTDEEKNAEYERLLNKLPDISEWEADVLKELEKNV